MKGIGNYRQLFLIFLLAFISVEVQAQKLWAELHINPNNPYLGQPVEVNIFIYSSTWFTTAPDLGNIKVPGAFSYYLRSVSVSKQEGSQTFAGVQLIYNIFPYTDKDVVFPDLNIALESPEVGDYKGKKHVIKAKGKTIKVKPIPSKFSENEWLVANGLSVSERWSGNRAKVKVGDVVERTISRTVSGTVSELIPPIEWDSIANVSLYPSRSEVSNNQTKTSISASRTEKMRYLFEKEGEVILPEMVFTWYNPYRNQLYKRTLKEVKIQVEPNPDLGVLASVRDSLAMIQEEIVSEEAEDQPLTILGMSPEKFAGVVVIGILVLILLFKALRKFVSFLKERRAAYLISEEYYFHEFKKAAHGKDKKTTAVKLYRWIDALDLKEPSAAFFAEMYGSESLQRQVATMEAKWGNGNQFSGLAIKEWEFARHNYLNRGVVVDSGWINP
jgi:hypothetical protein